MAKKKEIETHLSDVDLLKLEMHDTREKLKQKEIEIENLKLNEVNYKARLLQQNLQINHYEKLLQKQEVTNREIQLDELRKSKQHMLKSMSDKYDLGVKWGYDEFSGEIFREEKG